MTIHALALITGSMGMKQLMSVDTGITELVSVGNMIGGVLSL